MFKYIIEPQTLLIIITLTIIGTAIALKLSIIVWMCHIYSGGHWLSKIEAVVFRGIEKLDSALYKIADMCFGKGENA